MCENTEIAPSDAYCAGLIALMRKNNIPLVLQMRQWFFTTWKLRTIDVPFQCYKINRLPVKS